MAQGMGIRGKAAGTTALMAPKLWASGKHQQLLEYVADDVRITLAFVGSVKNAGTYVG